MPLQECEVLSCHRLSAVAVTGAVHQDVEAPEGLLVRRHQSDDVLFTGQVRDHTVDHLTAFVRGGLQ
jgi:hypothetical protein